MTLPSRALAAAIRSLTERMGLSAPTTMKNEVWYSPPMGVKSALGSYGSFLNSDGLMAKCPTSASRRS